MSGKIGIRNPWSWKCWQKKNFFSPLVGDREFFVGLNESLDYEESYSEKTADMYYPLLPMTDWLIKIEISAFFGFQTPQIKSKEVANTLFFAQLVIANFTGRKRLKIMVKCGKNRKFQNLLEVQERHECRSSSRRKWNSWTFFPFWPPFPPEWTSRFLLPNKGKWPLSRLVIAFRSISWYSR